MNGLTAGGDGRVDFSCVLGARLGLGVWAGDRACDGGGACTLGLLCLGDGSRDL